MFLDPVVSFVESRVGVLPLGTTMEHWGAGPAHGMIRFSPPSRRRSLGHVGLHADGVD